MRDPFIPPAQGPAGSFFNDGLLVVFAGKAADSVNAGEERDRGEHDLLAVTLAQQARTAETLDMWVPITSSTLCDQVIFVDHATDMSLFSDAIQVEVDRLG
jgi:hypothetical protein